jgi:ectoine hydroxylase-related dioxygenase (phytanoyl-CoA dioxygenase family)
MSATVTAPAESSSIALKSEVDHQRPLPEVAVIDSSTATVDQVVKALIKAGGCIIKNAVPTEALAEIEKDTRSYLDADTEWKGDFFPKQTRRVNGLAAKSKAFMQNIVCYKLYQDVCTALLSSSVNSWLGEERIPSISKPQLNNTIIFSIGPGARAQGLHRDDMIHHNLTERINQEDYTIGQDTGIGFFVGGKRTTRQNGATRFIPGSHLWGLDTPPSEDLAVYAELEPGDGFIMLSSCYHGGSANTTTDEERLVYSCFMTKGFLRQVCVIPPPSPLCVMTNRF